MATTPVRRTLSALIGAVVGYLVWLGATAIIAATTPVRFWVLSGAIVLVALTSIAVALAVRHKHTLKAAAFWSAPVLPILFSVYLLVVVVT
ncbi:hypothetical protein [Mycolicibacterium aichiense]|uniref:Transmembrane protein n=1 Tax=Mycolicibacterium aichiense TaxID=1799 RepID=A0AAD1HHI8_9MYCO|nr:hypothetical protein [Mycolicibacterium aichiense]MCV7020920.1 hypothetical protein [Mycolicibacterium aichiense]BBX05488.1 hypothetical protein MAIC_02910 [Mycolicibacterium aichiense]STZ25160.1 Uncharacterised protein [Mycolicibacterium aichiense]